MVLISHACGLMRGLGRLLKARLCGVRLVWVSLMGRGQACWLRGVKKDDGLGLELSETRARAQFGKTGFGAI